MQRVLNPELVSFGHLDSSGVVVIGGAAVDDSGGIDRSAGAGVGVAVGVKVGAAVRDDQLTADSRKLDSSASTGEAVRPAFLLFTARIFGKKSQHFLAIQ
jgi:hypothetical protein